MSGPLFPTLDHRFCFTGHDKRAPPTFAKSFSAGPASEGPARQVRCSTFDNPFPFHRARQACPSAYRELERLIHEEWKTHADGQTDQNGVYHVRGFRGRYLVRIGRGNTWVVRTLAVDGNEPALLEVVWEMQN
ncbi:hypothetical protein THTE_0610 [Thermogutta terrifontis]|uniref:Uncharacterized protein n=1 Tax=Thermogutta terrifontis TaxID=1331910 RepID=A0A286RB73_9BACT|nr:hypothetical protein THTE_0610 [Thermogutta terrifontis]